MTKFWGGRANRANFWLMWAVIFALSLLLGRSGTYSMSAIFIVICVNRLHDIGRSGWWVIAINLPSVAAAIAGVAAGMNWMVGLAVLLSLVPLIWLGSARGQEGANKYGEAPPPGIMWRASRKQSVADAFD